MTRVCAICATMLIAWTFVTPAFAGWVDGFEPWWAAQTDPSRNLLVQDPLNQRGTVLQVWGEMAGGQPFANRLLEEQSTYELPAGSWPGAAMRVRGSRCASLSTVPVQLKWLDLVLMMELCLLEYPESRYRIIGGTSSSSRWTC